MSSNINIPQSPPVDVKTGNWNTEWLLWILNPHIQTLSVGSAIDVDSGGTGLTTPPGAGQLLVGNGSGYDLSATIPSTALPGLAGDVTSPSGSNNTTLATVNAGVGSFGSGTSVAAFTVNAKGLITAASGANITGAVGSFTVGAGFGCNGKAAQTAAAVNANIAGSAGAAYTATEQGLINSLLNLVNQLRAALVANGIAI